jgi:hypothetical protein
MALRKLGIIGVLTLSIARYSTQHNVSDTESVPILRCGGEIQLLCLRFGVFTAFFNYSVGSVRKS